MAPSLGSSKAEIQAAKQAASRSSNGGLVLIDDGTGRLREARPSDNHPAECVCHFCRQVCCVLCHAASPANTKIWRGLTGFGRHIQSKHSEVYNFNADLAREKRLVRQLKEFQTAKEIKRIARSGIRRVNLKSITEGDLENINAWILQARALQRENSAADPLLLSAIEKADERYLTQDKFNLAVRTLASEISRGRVLGRLVTSQRETHFDPRVAIELLKICYATGRGWSFIVHIILLYGLEAFCAELATQGVSPPTTLPKVPSPEQIMAQGLAQLDGDET